MFVNKGKVNKRIKFLCCIMRNLQENLNIIWHPLSLDKPPIFPYPLFSSKNFLTPTPPPPPPPPPPAPISINFGKVETLLYEGVFEVCMAINLDEIYCSLFVFYEIIQIFYQRKPLFVLQF